MFNLTLEINEKNGKNKNEEERIGLFTLTSTYISGIVKHPCISI